MIPNLINTAIGIALVYISILAPHVLEGHTWPMVVVGAVILLLSLWARRSDTHPWQSNTNLLLAALLGVLGLVQTWPLPLVTFWGLFWAGLLVAVLSLWAVLYRPATPTESEEEA